MVTTLKDYGYYADTNRISAWRSTIPSGLDTIPFGCIIGNEAISSTGQPILVYGRRIDEIEKEVKALKEVITKINSRFDPEGPVIVDLRDVSRDQAKKEIKEYFEAHHGENLYSHDITQALCIELEMVDDVLAEMERDGQIKEVSVDG